MHILSYAMVLEDAIMWLHLLNMGSRKYLITNHLSISKVLKTKMEALKCEKVDSNKYRGNKTDMSFNIIITGDKDVGKSCLLN